jgi:sulfur carrier protein
MEITINHKSYDVDDRCSLEYLLNDVLQSGVKGIAIAVNQHIVPKSAWPEHVLQHGDQIIIIKATQGG